MVVQHYISSIFCKFLFIPQIKEIRPWHLGQDSVNTICSQ